MTVQSKFPLVKIPHGIQVSLYLIREELKSRKLFHALQEAGIDDCYFQPHLDTLILEHAGLDADSDVIFNRYNEIMDYRSRKIGRDPDTLTKQALKVYTELKQVKRENNL